MLIGRNLDSDLFYVGMIDYVWVVLHSVCSLLYIEKTVDHGAVKHGSSFSPISPHTMAKQLSLTT